SGLQAGLLTQKDYDYLLVFALGSLLLTPLMLKFGLRWSQADDVPGEKSARAEPWNVPDDISRAVVIGIGHIGRQLALHLETRGVFVCAVDLSALNVHALAQQGFATVVGNAQDYETLERAHLFQSQVAIVCVPEDTAAIEIVKTIRSSHPQCTILVRCRYRLTSEILKSAGAHFVIVEESQSSIALIDVLTEKEII
ncbi:MAG: hypothetical protein GY868_16700, partial [Deltaproteobacteria bacterium]|nr:hypothetical protein [Deltaproteobacteria bacterium]